MTDSTALVTGAAGVAEDVAAALRAEGWSVLLATDPDALAAAVDEVGAEGLQCYVQLPGEIPARGETVIERVRNFLVDGLLSRFDAAAAILPALAPGGVVLFVTGNHPGQAEAPDNPAARRALLDMLAACCRLERPEAGLRPVVLRHSQTPAEIAAFARRPTAEAGAALAELVQSDPEQDFSHWRDEVLALVNTYS